MIIELLAPAGNLEKFKIAILYGADAVYVAGQQFSLRQAASNFSLVEMQSAIFFAHKLKRKVYITVNAFLHDLEIEQLIEYLKGLESIGPDALICSDLGVVNLAIQYTSIPIHVSTQSSVINSYHARIWKEFGVKRIVVGRELSLNEAAQLKEQTGLEIELFIHGAMCMAYSGHCSMSTFIADRDSNRGGCIQNCRYRYTLRTGDDSLNRSHILSSKDLCGIQLLPEFASAGIDSIKIEGRMKSNLYIASTVRAYANAIAEFKSGKPPNMPDWSDELKKVPYRGYTTGSLQQEAGPESVYDPSEELCKEFKLAGTVIETDPAQKRFAFQVKNKLKTGDRIEIMPFTGNTISISIQSISDLSGSMLSIAQPNNIIWLPWQQGIETHNVARMQT
jgi:putative protease